MTNEEARGHLRYITAMIEFDPLTGNDRFLNDDDKAQLEALEMGIEALKKQEERKWIPVSDRVPEDDRLVIVCTESGQVYTDYYFDDKPDFWELAHIIAWQDLPMSWQDSLKTHKKEESE